jgi:disulfide bond formation protein DsbB
VKKKFKQLLAEIEIIDALIGLIGVIIILSAALVMQFVYYEKPCPLCLLQRAAFVNIGIALLLNFKFGNRVAHWSLVILSGIAGIAVSIRQILLHINDPVGMGSAVLGLHMYTWCFIGFATAIVGSTLMLIIYPEKTPTATIKVKL